MAENMLDTSNLGIAKGREGGYACVAPAGTDPTAFTDVSKTLAELCATNATLKSLGYISEDGVTISADTDTDDISDWSGAIVASPMSSFGESIDVTFLESRDSVLKSVYGDDNVTTAKGTTTVRHNKNFTGAHLYIFDAVVSDTKVKRVIVPNGVIVERDDQEMNNSDLAGYTPTIKCLPSNFFDGDTMREYIYDTTYTDGGPHTGDEAASEDPTIN